MIGVLEWSVLSVNGEERVLVFGVGAVVKVGAGDRRGG